MRGVPLALTSTILLLAPVLAPGSLAAQGRSDSLPLAAGTRVRVQGTSLGSGWHDGHLVQLTVTGTGDCLAFSPAAPSRVAAILLNASDSLEVWVQPRSTDSSVARADTTGVQGQWVGVSHARRQALSLGCRRSGH